MSEFDAGAGELGVVLERTRDGFRLAADLMIEVGDLRLEFLDARMAVEQRGGLFGELRAQRHTLLGQSADQLGIEDVGGFDRLAGAQHVANELSPRFGVGFLRARCGDLRRDVAELLGRKRGIVGADKRLVLPRKFATLASASATRFCIDLDFAGQPLPGGLCLLALGAALPHQIGVGDGVGDPRGESGILGEEIDDDDAGFVDRVDGEPVVIGFQHALFVASCAADL